MLFRVDGHTFIAGFIVYDMRVAITAPILYKLRGLSCVDALRFCKRKGWDWELVS